MARIRTIKPEFPQSESMGRVSRDARLLFIMLWTIADDDGRARANSRMLASLLFPYDDDAPKQIGKWLAELERENCVTLYQVGGQSYLAICGWHDHQKIDRPNPSKLPAPCENTREDSREIAIDREASPPDQGREGTKEGKGPRARSRDLSLSDLEAFETWYALYPHKVGRGAAERAFASALKASSLDVLVEGVRQYVAKKPQDVPWCNPATWLNGKRWLDQPAPQANLGASGGTADDAEYSRWKARMAVYKPGKFWLDTWGPKPEDGRPPSCPADLYDAWKQRQQVAA